jgi:ribonuclease P protein component
VKATVKSPKEVSLFFSEGKRYSTPYATLFVLEQHGPHGRVAVIAGKKSGGSVWRNAAKRRLRAIIHDQDGPWDGYDVAFVAKRTILEDPYDKVLASTAKALRKAGISTSASR